MKKSLVLLSISALCAASWNVSAQSVGISNDGSAPHPSAMLDVKSDSKGILVPRMATNKRTGITSPAEGLMVYDTDTKSFWYIKSGAWTEIGGLKLPYNESVAASGNAMLITNGYISGNAIVGQAFGGAGISGYSETGAGGLFSSQSGPGIRTVGSGAEINGKVKIADGTQGTDRVLTSDAAGIASWKPLPTAKTAMTSLFDINNDTYITVPASTHMALPFVANPATPAYAGYGYDAGANFNHTTHEYTVPSDGLYRVSFKLVLKGQVTPAAFTSGSYFYPSLSKVTPGETPDAFDYIFRSWAFEYKAGDSFPVMLTGEASTYFKAGTSLKFLLYHLVNSSSDTHPSIQLLGGRYSFFSVVKVE